MGHVRVKEAITHERHFRRGIDGEAHWSGSLTASHDGGNRIGQSTIRQLSIDADEANWVVIWEADLRTIRTLNV